MPTFRISELSPEPKDRTLLNLFARTDLFESKGHIRRLFKQGAIKLDGEKKEDCDEIMELSDDEEGVVVKSGKKLFIKFVG